ncbi:MAG: methionine synthase [Chloroflexota bacterium]
MPRTEFNCLPTMIGSLPHTDPREACSLVRRFLGDIPAWPQLPRLSPKENMYLQYSQGFPGAVVSGDRVYVDRSRDLTAPLEQLYRAYLENDADKYPVSPEYAAGLHYCLGLDNLDPLAVKGQLTGPITWGLTVTDNEGRAILYDDVLGDAVPRFLRLKAAWQEKALGKISKKTIIFIDEPYLAAYGSTATGSLSVAKVREALEEVFGGISGLKGVHCCGNTDWSVLLGTSTDIISFDAYNYARSLSLYPAEVKGFLEKGGTIAWGIVPTEAEALAGETVASLKDRLEEAMVPFTRNGLPFRQLVAQGLLTPGCGLASLPTPEAAARALELLAGLSDKMRGRYRS